MNAIPFALPLPWLPSVAIRTPPKPSAQPSALRGVIRSALPYKKCAKITPIKLWVLFKMPPIAPVSSATAE